MKPSMSLEQQLERSVFHARAKRLGKTKMTQALVVHRDVSGPLEFTPEQQQMIRDTYANGASETEFRVLLEIAKVRRLNPLLKQVHFVKRRNKQLGRDVWSAQVSIDGLRAVAHRTGLYAGQDEPEYERDKDGYILSCKVKVYRKDWGNRPAVGIAYWSEYVQSYDGKPTKFWADMPHVMIAKCAESIALRKAFPEDLSGIYTDEEMEQADNVTAAAEQLPTVNPHTLPGESLSDPPQPNDEFEAVMGMLMKADRALFDPAVEYGTVVHWRNFLGNKALGIRTEFGATVSRLYQSDAISAIQRADMSKQSNRIDRKLTALEGKLKPPPIEASFTDEPDDGTEAFAPEREPGEEG